MPPEQPPYLVILNLSREPAGVTGRATYVRPQTAGDVLRVRWGIGSPPPGYVSKANGVVFVSGASTNSKPDDEAPNINRHGDRFTFSEGFDGAPWLMLTAILPPGEELTDVEPLPAGSRLYGDRLAVYWRLSPGLEGSVAAKVSWSLRRIADVGDALARSRGRDALPFDPDEGEPKFQLFLSYRKKEDNWAAGRIYHLLTLQLGENSVFRDVSGIRLGTDFRTSIDDAIGRCRVLLPIIGPDWLDPEKPMGERRIDSEADWPRIEIELALQRHKRIVPVFLDDARIPRDTQLPRSLEELKYLQGMTLREERLESDIDALVTALTPFLR